VEEIQFTFSDLDEADSIKKLLNECSLPDEDIVNHLPHFIVAKGGHDLIGVIGLEVYDKVGLLRSLAVREAYREKGIAKSLYARLLAYAHLQGIEELFLLTNTAEVFFSKIGFKKVDRDNAPDPIKATKEFQSLCPSTAVCMAKKIDKDAQYYPEVALLPKTEF
jgi:amino-acid N-acetyltransferase